MTRPWLAPLVPLYRAGVQAKNFAFARGLLRVRRLQSPVISVGSLSAGGAGKTPVVLMLAGLLQREGVTVDVLSRGYGRTSGKVEEVDPAGPAGQFGDEPLEMARRGIRVVVGADRFAAGTLAESEPHPGRDGAATKMGHTEIMEVIDVRPRDLRGSEARVHLLDDGFQHRRLARDLNVVLLTLEDCADGLLPAGNLREPLRSLSRADVIVLREDEAQALAGVVATWSKAEVWLVRRRLQLPPGRPQRPLVFCGIARPEGFLHMLRDAGVRPAAEVRFGDHHPYTHQDFGRLLAAARQTGADGFCTTAKDAVKIPEQMRLTLQSVGPVVVAGLEVSLVNEAAAVACLQRVLLGRTRSARPA